MTFNYTKLALGMAAAAFSLAIVAPVAQADTSAKLAAVEASQKADALEAQMQKMAESMKAMQAELERVKSASANASNANAKVQELDQWMASVKQAPEAVGAKDNLVAVRGGWSQLDHARSDGGGLLSDNKKDSGFYVGGAFDFNVNNDLFGLVDDTSFMVELGFQYDQFGTATNNLTTALGPTLSNHQSTDSRLRLNASPKIKFMHGSKLRPWIIPVGLELNIIGVPSNAVSVLNSGMQFGAGAEYDLFKGIVLGVDGRYHYSTGKIDGTPTDGLNLGGYVGFKF